MKSRVLFALLAVASICSLAVAQDAAPAKADAAKMLPAKGLPVKADVVFRLNLAAISKLNLTQTLDAIAKAIPASDAEAHKELASFRKDALPAIIEARDELHKGGIREIVMVPQQTPAKADDADDVEADDAPAAADDEATSDTYMLLRVTEGTKPAEAKAVIAKAMLKAYKAMEPQLKEAREMAADGPAAGLAGGDAPKTAAEVEKQLDDLELTQWGEGWLLARKKSETPKVPEPVTTNQAAFAAALARSKDAPVSAAFAMSDQARAEANQAAMQNPMFGALSAGMAKMQWAAGWLDLSADPRLQVVFDFPNAADAASFNQGINQLAMMFGMMSGMNGEPEPAAKALIALVADLMPVHEAREVKFVATTATLRKFHALMEAQQAAEAAEAAQEAQPVQFQMNEAGD
jgi:hypothetical protein